MKRDTVLTVLVVFLVLCLFVTCLIKPERDYSDSERRKLAGFPTISVDRIWSDTFMDDFEHYAADQFPFREKFRGWKAYFSTKILARKDNNELYKMENHLSKMDYPLKKKSVKRAMDRFQYICEKYFSDQDVNLYLSVIPDKNYYLAKENGYLAMDYEELFRIVKKNGANMEYIDITKELSLNDYYFTDPHWKQEKIVDVAQKLADAMGIVLSGQYEERILEEPFYGTYYGQAALKAEADELRYLTNDKIEQYKVYNYENGKTENVHNMEKASGKDPYEMFLSGPVSLLTIENNHSNKKKELILFRDSFGSSIAPLLAEGYEKVTLIDIRYIHPDMLGKYIEFYGQDVLFLYSTSVLNRGEMIK